MSPRSRSARSVPGLLAIALLTFTGLSGCLGAAEADVYATFYPMAFLSHEIAGDTVGVGQILPEGAEPHLWEPSVRDLSRLGSARLVIAQGHGFEPWLDRLVSNLGSDGPRVVHTAERLDLDENDHDEEDEEDEPGPDAHDHGPVDPHTWLDPVRLAEQAVVVRDAMTDAFPEHEETFHNNTASLVERLDELDRAFQERLKVCETHNIVVLHDAFAYLGERYGFEIHSVTGLSPQAEPDAQAVARAVDKALELDLGVVFTDALANPSVMNAIAADASQKGSPVEVQVLSTVERRSSEEREAGLDYLGIMDNNLDALSGAMRCAGT